MEPKLARVRRVGSSFSVVIPKQLCDSLIWKPGDVIALRLAGEKLILERVALDKLAVLRGPGTEGLRP